MTHDYPAPRFGDVFANRHAVLPVIHVDTETQAAANVEVAVQGGADGVFLINHEIDADALWAIYAAVAERFPDTWLGVNCLDLTPEEVFEELPERVDGVWADDAMIDERAEEQPDAQRVLDRRRAAGSRALYFGGVAFKYQRHVKDLASAAGTAARFMDVATTSGAGTGMAAHVGKIKTMKEALGTFPLAIASGITPDNVADYLPHADAFLVATGISRSFTQLDPGLLARLVERVRSYAGSGEPAPAVSPWGRVCFVCECNDGRSAHLELSVRRIARECGRALDVRSAGLSQGGGINRRRREFLLEAGVAPGEIEGHRPAVFNATHAGCGLILVAGAAMKDRLLQQWPQLDGRVMTIRAFAQGQQPGHETLSADAAHLDAPGGHGATANRALYDELEALAFQIATRLCG